MENEIAKKSDLIEKIVDKVKEKKRRPNNNPLKPSK